MVDIESLARAAEQVVALIFVNLVPFLLAREFLYIAISIDCLVLGISTQALMGKKTEQRLDEYSRHLINLVDTAINLVRNLAPLSSHNAIRSSQQKVVR